MPAGFRDASADRALEAAITEVLTSRSYEKGTQAALFMQELAAYCGVGHAIGVSGRIDALRLAMMAVDVRPGTEVITVSYGPAAATAAALQLHAVPRLVDIDEDTATMSTARLCEAISDRTSAIVPVHLSGRPADMDTIMEIGSEFGIPVIEEASEALGAQYYGDRVGALGDLAVIGFDLGSHMHGTGDGAAITTNSGDLAERVRLLAGQSLVPMATAANSGWHSHLDELQAAMLRVHLERLDETNDEGWLRVDRLLQRLATVDGVTLRAEEDPDSYSVYGPLLLRCTSLRGLEHLTTLPDVLPTAARTAVHTSTQFSDRVVTGELPVTSKYLESSLLV